MDCFKIGQLIASLRKERTMTQKQLADQLHISNKTVSKWERGQGCPDVALWEALSSILGADLLKLLQGEMSPNRPDIGRMDRIRFYRCPTCGNILTSTGSANLSCCGRRLSPLIPTPLIEGHEVKREEVDIEYYVTLNHEMTREHYIVFAAYVLGDRIYLARLYPEQEAAFVIPLMSARGTLYIYCSKHGFQRC